MSEPRTDSPRLEALLARQLEGRLSEREAQELRALLWDDARARDIYIRHCEMHAMLTEERDILGALEDEPPNVVSLPRRTRPPIAAGLDTYARSAAFGGVCAAAGILVALFALRFAHEPSTRRAPEAIAHSAVELVREAKLPDGSTVELAPKSAVSVRYAPSERAIELQGGEAHFSAAHDEERPFVVTAGRVRVRAIGTAFNVRRAGERVVVTVTDGQVAVSRVDEGRAASGPDAFLVSAGGQFRWDVEEPDPVLASVDPVEALSWREGRLEYTSEPLRAVVADLNRYTDRPVILRGEELGGLRVAGTILTNATTQWLLTLPESLPVRVEAEEGAWVIRSAVQGR